MTNKQPEGAECELQHCPTCNQMTNHQGEVCLKCPKLQADEQQYQDDLKAGVVMSTPEGAEKETWEKEIAKAIINTYPESVWLPIPEDKKAKDAVAADLLRCMAPAMAKIAIDTLEPLLLATRSQAFEEAREEERKRVVEVVKKHKKANISHACLATNCSDPICGHSRCIDWMFTDLLTTLTTNPQ